MNHISRVKTKKREPNSKYQSTTFKYATEGNQKLFCWRNYADLKFNNIAVLHNSITSLFPYL